MSIADAVRRYKTFLHILTQRHSSVLWQRSLVTSCRIKNLHPSVSKIRIYYASEYLTMEREVICSICLSQHCHEMHCKTCTATEDKVVCKTCIRKMFRICTCHQRDVYYTCPHCRTKIKEPGWVGECLESQKQIVRLLRSSKIP